MKLPSLISVSLIREKYILSEPDKITLTLFQAEYTINVAHIIMLLTQTLGYSVLL